MDSYEDYLRSIKPDYDLQKQHAEAALEHFLVTNSGLKNSSDEIIIPVVVHIIYKTTEQNLNDDQVKSQIDVLNEDYRLANANRVQTPEVWKSLSGNLAVKFQLARRSPSGSSTDGIIRVLTTVDSFYTNNAMKFTSSGGSNAWPDTSYLNIWVCNLAGNVLGYGQLPGGDPQTDGIVVNTRAFGRTGNLMPKYSLGRTTTHEAGHWLNLLHIWGDANCGNDNVSDTPVQKSSNTGCPSFPHVSCCNGSSNCNSPNGDMFMNYMDYSDDACMTLFTQKQGQRMEAVLNTSRIKISSSTGSIPVATPASDLHLDEIKTPTGLLCNYSYVPEIIFQNNGLNAISSFNLKYWIDGNDPQEHLWSGTLAPGASAILSLDAQSSSAGLHTFFAKAVSVNGSNDDYTINNFLSRSFIIAPDEYECPVLPSRPDVSVAYSSDYSEIVVTTQFKLAPLATVSLVNSLGKIIYRASLNNSSGDLFRFNISGLAPAIYFIQVKTLNESGAAKFIVLH